MGTERDVIRNVVWTDELVLRRLAKELILEERMGLRPQNVRQALGNLAQKLNVPKWRLVEVFEPIITEVFREAQAAVTESKS